MKACVTWSSGISGGVGQAAQSPATSATVTGRPGTGGLLDRPGGPGVRQCRGVQSLWQTSQGTERPARPRRISRSTRSRTPSSLLAVPQRRVAGRQGQAPDIWATPGDAYAGRDPAHEVDGVGMAIV